MGHAVFDHKLKPKYMLFFALVGLLTLFSSAVLANKSGVNKSLGIQTCINSALNSNLGESLEKRLQSNGWPKEAIRLHFDYQRSVLQEPRILEKYCADLVRVIGEDFEFAELILSEEANVGYSETVGKLGYQFVTGYFGSGMKRISSTELKPFFDFTYELFGVLEPEACVMFWRPNANENIDMNQMMQKYQGFISLEVQKQYLEMSRKAIIAEVTNWPPVTIIDEFETRNLEAFFGNWLTQYSEKFPEPYRLALMLNGQLEGTPEEYCDLGRLYYGALATVPGRDGDRVRKLIADSLN